MSKIIIFPPIYLIETHHIISHKHVTGTKSFIVFNIFYESIVVSNLYFPIVVLVLTPYSSKALHFDPQGKKVNLL